MEEEFHRVLAWVWDHHPSSWRIQRVGQTFYHMSSFLGILVDMLSLINLLILHINGQLSSTYTGHLSAVDESLALASQNGDLKQDRLAKNVIHTEYGIDGISPQTSQEDEEEEAAEDGDGSDDEEEEINEQKYADTFETRLGTCGTSGS